MCEKVRSGVQNFTICASVTVKPPGLRKRPTIKKPSSSGSSSSSSSCKGRRAENEARDYLKKQKCEIIETNWRCRWGEIDIIAKDSAGYICFIEVKYRSGNSHGTPGEAIDKNKKEQLIKLARIYISHHPEIKESDMRFDAVVITPSKIDLFKNAFYENEV
ncbi:MAG: YraN family protein [Elusimicrobia bacterium]|nr:YraN family protein [Elusimicrobiota bacterium]